MQLQRILVVGALAGVLLVSDPMLGGPALAGPVEELTQIARHPSDENVMVLRYLYGGEGMFMTRDGGASWHLVCNTAISPTLTRGGPLAVTSSGQVFMGVFQGLWASDAEGCGWTTEGSFADVWVRDLVAHPSDPGVLFAITSKGGAENGVYRYSSSGWEAMGAQADMLISRIHVTDTGSGLRFYQSAQTAMGMEDGSPNYVIRVSDDEGATWTDLPFGAADGTLRLEGVDPENPDRLVASMVRDEAEDSVLVSADGGATWSEYATMTSFGGLAFAADGRVWLGDSGDTTDIMAPKGLMGAASLDEAPTVLSDEFPVNCLTHRQSDDSLFVCKRFEAGRFDLTDNTLTTTFKFTDVTSFASCDDVDMVESCRDQLLSGYCGITHFPMAPVCEPYDVDLSALGEECAFDFDAGIGTGTTDAGGCLMDTPATGVGGEPTSPSGPSGMAGSGDMEPSTPSGGGGPRIADAGTSDMADEADEDEDDGGCSAASGSSGGAWPLALGLLLLAIRRRRTR